jgi:RNA-splicing ligase RtcB
MSDLKIFTQNVEPVALNQIYTLLSQPSFANQRVRIMPDVHAGAGCVVGFTSTVTDKIIPNLIGVDIGCGMLSTKLNLTEIDLEKLDIFIKKSIPCGSEVLKEVDGEDLIKSLYCNKELRNMERLLGSLGTLGGGNHFIEVDKAENGELFLIIHSGSRNLGMQVAKIYQNLAVKRCKNAAQDERAELISSLKSQGRVSEIPNALSQLTQKYAHLSKIPADLCYLEGADMQAYLHDMKICQEFAKRNRKKMADKILEHLKVFKCEQFETIHNFIAEDNVIRKGAVPAYKGVKILIPMNMRDGCLICEGLGNEDWNNSAPHGAGRILSRSAARAQLSMEVYAEAMKGIYTTSVNNSTLDESPMAYKSLSDIVDVVAESVDILEIIKPIYNFKAAD